MSVSIRLKHSSVRDKAPTAGDLTDGELALNVNENSPAAYIKDSAGNIVKLAGAGAVGSDDQWTRTGTELAPTKAGDDVFTSGDVKVGNTTGAPNITLNGSDGSAEFAGDVTIGTDISLRSDVGYVSGNRFTVGGSAGSAGGPREAAAIENLSDAGALLRFYKNTEFNGSSENATNNFIIAGSSPAANTARTPKWLVNSSGSQRIGGTLPGSPNILLDATDGSATFAGNVQVGDATPSSTDVGVYLRDIGGVYSNRSGAARSPVFVGVDSDTGVTTTTITKDGSAEFASNVKIGGTLPSAPNISLNADGSAEFAGQITVGTNSSSQSRSTVSTGLVTSYRATNTGSNVFQGGYGSTETSSIKSDGSAEFAGRVNVNGSYTVNYGSTLGTGFCYIRNDNTSPTTVIGIMKDGSTSNDYSSQLLNDGSAEFTGQLISGDFQSNGTGSGTKLFSGGSVGVSRQAVESGTATMWAGYYGSGAATSRIRANGDATFAGTVTATVVPPSDVKFKENITDASPQLADVVALGNQLKNFDWNADAPVNDEIRAQRQLGLVAQEAEKVCPSLVKTIKRTKQGKELTPETTDEEGNVTPATYEELDDSFKGISHDALIYKLLGAIAELQAEVEALKNK